MRLLVAPLRLIAVAGFLASLIVHVLALTGLAGPFGSEIWLLHIGVVVVWFPTILIERRLTGGARQADFWKAPCRGCPGWVNAGVRVLGGYALLNFVIFVLQISRYPANEAPDVIMYRGLSGHWMFFYYIGAATLYSVTMHESPSPRHCANGHEVSLFATHCDVCGIQLRPQEEA